MRKILQRVGACLLLGLAYPAFAQIFGGTVTVVDGDTLDFGGTPIRLAGVDAPEIGQVCDRAGENWACGDEAREMLAGLVTGREVECLVNGRGETGVQLGLCTADGLDLSDAMVRAGFAVVPADSGNDYAEAQDIARKFSLGIWASRFDAPVDWRAVHPRPVSVESLSAPAGRTMPRVYRDDLGRCAIKGNRSYRGDWIYYLPGQNYYNQTRPEDRFCTEEAAQRAGYRASRAG